MTAELQGIAGELRAALRALGSPWAGAAIEPLPDSGLAHAHLRLVGTGVLARVPKQSQMNLPAQANLDYQAACFARAAASGHTPRLHGVLAASPELPRGALLVEEIAGRSARLPQDLPAVVEALAAIHGLPLPEASARTPLLDPPDPLELLRTEVEAQAEHLDAAGLDARSRAAIDRARDALRAACAEAVRPPKRLIAFDAHPGNFIVRADGTAVLVDLEKARYSHPPLDLAHATLYTSTTWDRASSAALTLEQVVQAIEHWSARCIGAAAWRGWVAPLRAAMWLWSVTWCAKWRVVSAQTARRDGDGEDWTRERSDAALVAHVRERVDHYLSAPIVLGVVDELEQLRTRLQA
jgi:thiamine kinase-like enzyme